MPDGYDCSPLALSPVVIPLMRSGEAAQSEVDATTSLARTSAPPTQFHFALAPDPVWPLATRTGSAGWRTVIVAFAPRSTDRKALPLVDAQAELKAEGFSSTQRPA